MTKKYFAQPALAVVNINRNDIIVTSGETLGVGDPGSAVNAEAPGMRMFDSWDSGY